MAMRDHAASLQGRRPLFLLFPIFVLLSLPRPAHGQPVLLRGFSLQVGTARVAQSDEQSSPLHHSGSGLSAGIAWQRPRPDSRLAVEADFLLARLLPGRSGLSNLSEQLIGGGLGTRYARLLSGSTDARDRLFLGGRLQIEATYRQHTYATASEHYLESFLWLGPWLRFERGLEGEPGGYAGISTALAALTMRSPWTGLKYTPDVGFDLPYRLQILEVEAGVRIVAGRGLGGTLEYRARLLRHDDRFLLARVVHFLRFSISGGRR